MPEVKLSISDGGEVAVSILGTTLLDIDCWPFETFRVEGSPAELFNGDFRLTRVGFGASFRGCGGARVFFTTTGGIELPRELIDESGLTLCEVPGLWDIVIGPFDGACKRISMSYSLSCLKDLKTSRRVLTLL